MTTLGDTRALFALNDLWRHDTPSASLTAMTPLGASLAATTPPSCQLVRHDTPWVPA